MRVACVVCGEFHSALEPCRSVRSGGTGTQPLRADAADPSDPLIGSTLGNFRIVRMLGRGGMGTVYLGEHAVIGSKVAVKFLHPHLAGDRGLVERFFAEARAANLIGHENIVNIFDLSLQPPNRYYLVMEYLEGEPLSAVKVPLDAQRAVPILMQVCDALQAAHAAGVIHRDLKPENVFLIRRGNSSTPFVKIVDFGIAKLGEAAAGITAAGLAVGTPEYMAPEQWTGDPIDGRADLYALGVIAYGLATGRLPFHESAPLAYYVAHREKPVVPPRQLNPELPAALETVILTALEKDRDRRYRSALEMRAALQAALAGPGPAGPRPSAPEPALPRHPASVTARVRAPGLAARELTAADLSRAGMYLCAEPPFPPLFARIECALLYPGGELDCPADVVRHVSAEQARAWGMQPGFAVQFADTSPTFQAAVERLMEGRPPVETPRVVEIGDDLAAEPQIEFFRKRLSGDHYALLGLGPAAECSEVRAVGRQFKRELEGLRARPLSARQRRQVDAAAERIDAAVAVLGTPAARAAYDANRSNFRGVARCLAAGLSVDELEELREAWLADHPRNATRAQIQLAGANAYLVGGDLVRAAEALETALVADPLRLELHQKYWTLKRRLAQSGGKGSPT